MKDRTIILTLTILAAVFFTFNTAYANEPSSLNLSYDLSSQTLSVSVGHYTYDVTVDYISTVEIKLNGKPYQTFNYSNQPNKYMATFSYNVEAKPGDLIEVTASSKLGGSKTSSITVGS